MTHGPKSSLADKELPKGLRGKARGPPVGGKGGLALGTQRKSGAASKARNSRLKKDEPTGRKAANVAGILKGREKSLTWKKGENKALTNLFSVPSRGAAGTMPKSSDGRSVRK